jgi:hypothetical protein
LIVRNREEFIRLADEVVVAMMEADKGSWSQIEAYIEKHSDAQFSHSICPECARNCIRSLGIIDFTHLFSNSTTQPLNYLAISGVTTKG